MEYPTRKTPRGAAWLLILLLGGLAFLTIVLANPSTTRNTGRVPTLGAATLRSSADVGASGAGAQSEAGAPGVPLNDAYLELRPATGAPPNGGTTQVGNRFVLEL